MKFDSSIKWKRKAYCLAKSRLGFKLLLKAMATAHENIQPSRERRRCLTNTSVERLLTPGLGFQLSIVPLGKPLNSNCPTGGGAIQRKNARVGKIKNADSREGLPGSGSAIMVSEVKPLTAKF